MPDRALAVACIRDIGLTELNSATVTGVPGVGSRFANSAFMVVSGCGGLCAPAAVSASSARPSSVPSPRHEPAGAEACRKDVRHAD